MRKEFYRAGAVLQELFYMYREKIFDLLISKVEKQGTEMFLYEGKYEAEETSINHLIFAFPSELMENLDDKRAILTHWTCSDALGWFYDCVKYYIDRE